MKNEKRSDGSYLWYKNRIKRKALMTIPTRETLYNK